MYMQSVFSRLHEEAILRQKKLEEEKMKTERTHAEQLKKDRVGLSMGTVSLLKSRTGSAKKATVGQRLYEEGVRKKREREEQFAKERAERERDPELTFQPRLSEGSLRIQHGASVWERITDEDQRIDHIRRLREEEDERKKTGCTFKPEINVRSKRMSQQHQYASPDKSTDSAGEGEEDSSSHFDRLYHDAERRKERQMRYESWVSDATTFQPNISTTSRLIAARREGETREDFYERLAQSKKVKEEELEELRQKLEEEKIDPSTGKKLFHPDVKQTTSKYGPRRDLDVSIGDYLFEASKSRDQTRKLLEERNVEEARKHSKPRLSTRTTKLIEEVKVKRFLELFERLDSDLDGFVSADSVNVLSLTPHVKVVVTSMLAQLDGKELDEGAFSEILSAFLAHNRISVGSFLKELSLVPGNAGTSMEGDDDITFQPAINTRSQRIASKRRTTRQPVHDVLFGEKKRYDEHRRMLTEEREKRVMEECTFDPFKPGRSKDEEHME
jgi:hypothetical protein